MEKQTKILLGVAAAGVVAFLILKPKKATAQNNTSLGGPSTTKADSSNIIDNQKVTDVVKNTTSTTTRTTTTPPDVVRGTIKSPYLREGVEYIRTSDGAIAYADEISGRFNKYDPSHGNPWSLVNADPLFWEDTDIDWVNMPLDAFAGYGWGGRSSDGQV
jgi:hypothetical protein